MGLNFNLLTSAVSQGVWIWNSNEGDLTQNDPNLFIPELDSCPSISWLQIVWIATFHWALLYSCSNATHQKKKILLEL